MRPSDLNYQHLRYFWTVCREGTVQRAARRLHLAPSTVSGQIKLLEQQLGQPLFRRVGRTLEPTAFGRRVSRYADQIFELGDELARAAQLERARQVVRVGVTHVLPKLLVRELLAPAAAMPDVQLHIDHGPADELLASLTARRLDVVLSDGTMPSWAAQGSTSHLVVETHVAVFGTEDWVNQVGDRLPDGLGDVPWLVPPSFTTLRRGLEMWWESVGLSPDIAAVIDDSALLKAMGASGLGVFPAPERMLKAVLDSYPVACIGVTREVTERAWAVTRDPSPTDPAVRAICGLS